MRDHELIVLGPSAREPFAPDDRNGAEVLTIDELRGALRRGLIPKRLFRYATARVVAERHDLVPHPLAMAVILRLLARRGCWFEDDDGRRLRITPRACARFATRAIAGAMAAPRERAAVRRELRELAQWAESRGAAPRLPIWDGHGTIAYLYAHPAQTLRAGGSVGHVTGVIGALARRAPVRLLTTTAFPGLPPRVAVERIDPAPSAGAPFEERAIATGRAFAHQAARHLRGAGVGLVYQRSSVLNYAGILVARWLGVPFVLEYNGSEVWAQRHWGRPLRQEALAAEIERLNLRAADFVVVVSAPLHDEVIRLGVGRRRVIVNPNGVDPERYAPDVDGAAVRARRGIAASDLVVGFIGTFGRWHGAEVLVDAIAHLVADGPARRARLRVLLVGDGVTMPEVMRRIAAHGLEDVVVRTGLVPQADGPAHLAACDILVSPHVPNPDGTPFFGSPTKLFEYMAMGRPIVASELGQIGDVIDHEATGLLVPPGDVLALASAIARLLDDPALRARLGAAARVKAVARHTWDAHVARLLGAVMGSDPSC
jgi:glycosyltransferase involved in cell wall biosynthesis